MYLGYVDSCRCHATQKGGPMQAVLGLIVDFPTLSPLGRGRIVHHDVGGPVKDLCLRGSL